MASAGKDASPAWLDQFPTEILNDICKELCWHCHGEEFEYCMADAPDDAWCSFLALNALSQTSKRMRSIARPIQYHDPSPFLQPSVLLQNLHLDPDLAKHVKVLRLGDIESEMNQTDQQDLAIELAGKLRLLPRPGNLLRERSTYTPREKHLLRTKLHEPFYDQLMMALCSKVEAMAINFALSHAKPSLWKLPVVRREGAERLDNLRHLTIYQHDGYPFNLRHPGVGIVLNAAHALQTLVLVETQWLGYRFDEEPTFDVRKFAPALQNLTALELIDSKIVFHWHGPIENWDGPEYLALCDFIKMAKNLKHFRYISRTEDDGYEHIPPAYIIKALTPQCKTLETIEISTDDLTTYGEHPPVYPKLMVDRLALARFCNLHTLRLDETSFCEHIDMCDMHVSECQDWNCIKDMLPPTVKHLTIGMSCDFMDSFPDVDCLGNEANDGKFPALESVRVIFQFGPENGVCNQVRAKSVEFLGWLEATFEGTGIAVSIEPEGFFDSDYDSESQWEDVSDHDSEDSSEGHSDSDGRSDDE